MPDGGLALILEDRTEQLSLAANRDTLLRTRTAMLDSLFEALAVFAPDGTLQLWNHFEPEIDSSFAKNIMSNIEMPLIPVIIEMQRNGITLEKDNLENMSAELQSDMEILHESIVSHVGHSLNINSPSQLSQVLFNELDLPKTKKTKTGYSTDANSLEFLKTAHPIIEQMNCHLNKSV